MDYINGSSLSQLSPDQIEDVREIRRRLGDKWICELSEKDAHDIKITMKNLYWSHNLSLRGIASLFGRDYDTVCKWFKRFGIRKRSHFEAHALRRKLDRETILSLLPEWLRRKVENLSDMPKRKWASEPGILEIFERLYWDYNLSFALLGVIFKTNRHSFKSLFEKLNISVKQPIVTSRSIEGRRKISSKLPLDINTKVQLIYDRLGKMKSSGSKLSTNMLPREILKSLYLEYKLSLREIGILLGFSRSKIRKRLMKNGVPLRNISDALTKYHKTSFSEDSEEMRMLKCYMLGARCSDLYAYLEDRRVICTVSTTHIAWENLMKNLFMKFGHIRKYALENKAGYFSWSICAYLDNSFSFLLEKMKSIPYWILSDRSLFLNFLAGVSDSEGCISLGVEGNHLRFSINITLTDLRLLEDLSHGLCRLGFTSSIYKSPKGKGHFGDKTVWNLKIGKKKEIISLLAMLPFRHEEKITKAKFILNFQDSSPGIVYERWKLLSKQIKDSSTQYKELARQCAKNRSSFSDK